MITTVKGSTVIKATRTSRLPQGAYREAMKKNAALLAVIYALASGAMATESTKEKPEQNNNMEEVRVVGYDLSEFRGKLLMGLSGAYLIHEYDEKEDVWRFVRTSHESKEK